MAVRKGLVGFSVEDDKGNRWWFWSQDLDRAQQLFDALSPRIMISDEGQELKGGWVNLIAWDAHPSQEKASGLIIRQENRAA